jgi:hypothetical protein
MKQFSNRTASLKRPLDNHFRSWKQNYEKGLLGNGQWIRENSHKYDHWKRNRLPAIAKCDHIWDTIFNFTRWSFQHVNLKTAREAKKDKPPPEKVHEFARSTHTAFWSQMWPLKIFPAFEVHLYLATCLYFPFSRCHLQCFPKYQLSYTAFTHCHFRCQRQRRKSKMIGHGDVTETIRTRQTGKEASNCLAIKVWLSTSYLQHR